MSGRTLLASVAMACLPAIAALDIAPHANAAPAAQALLKRESSAGQVVAIKRRGRPLYVPIVPYSAYDYPYYYRRGFYPEHIGPGYIYYGYPYFYRKRYSGRCSDRYWRCVAAHNRRACRCR